MDKKDISILRADFENLLRKIEEVRENIKSLEHGVGCVEPRSAAISIQLLHNERALLARAVRDIQSELNYTFNRIEEEGKKAEEVSKGKGYYPAINSRGRFGDTITIEQASKVLSSGGKLIVYGEPIELSNSVSDMCAAYRLYMKTGQLPVHVELPVNKERKEVK